MSNNLVYVYIQNPGGGSNSFFPQSAIIIHGIFLACMPDNLLYYVGVFTPTMLKTLTCFSNYAYNTGHFVDFCAR